MCGPAFRRGCSWRMRRGCRSCCGKSAGPMHRSRRNGTGTRVERESPPTSTESIVRPRRQAARPGLTSARSTAEPSFDLVTPSVSLRPHAVGHIHRETNACGPPAGTCRGRTVTSIPAPPVISDAKPTHAGRPRAPAAAERSPAFRHRRSYSPRNQRMRAADGHLLQQVGHEHSGTAGHIRRKTNACGRPTGSFLPPGRSAGVVKAMSAASDSPSRTTSGPGIRPDTFAVRRRGSASPPSGS